MAKSNEIYVSEKGGYGNRNATFRIAEAYKMIRTNLLFALANADSRMVLVSSAEPSAGKSTLCANLAVVMAQTGAKVMLVDADMRRPVQHRNFRLSKTDGLSKILGGLEDINTCIHRQMLPNLDVIPSGSIPPNPSELLGSNRMKKLIETLNNSYDYIFVDTPPIGIVADALVMAPQTAGIVLVARQRQTSYEEVGECVEEIRQIGANFLGVVLTDVRTQSTSYAHYEKKRYYRSYDYRYGMKTNGYE